MTLEGGRVAELRHDFRRYYHCRYDDVSADEALDLIDMLPDGSRYVASVDFLRSWSEEQERDAKMLDAVNVLVWEFALDHGMMPEPPRVMRPHDVIERMRVRANSQKARKILEGDNWEEM